MEGSDVRFNIKKKSHHYTVTDTHKGIKINMEGFDVRFNIKRKGHHYTVTDTHKGIKINMEGLTSGLVSRERVTVIHQ